MEARLFMFSLLKAGLGGSRLYAAGRDLGPGDEDAANELAELAGLNPDKTTMTRTIDTQDLDVQLVVQHFESLRVSCKFAVR